MANRHKMQMAAGKNVGGAILEYGKPSVVASAKQKSNAPGAIHKAAGGSVKHEDEAQDKRLIKKMMADKKVVGKASGGRLDKRSRGGKMGGYAHGGSPFSAASKVKG